MTTKGTKKSKPPKAKKMEPSYSVEIITFEKVDRVSMAAWDDMWRMLLEPLLQQPPTAA